MTTKRYGRSVLKYAEAPKIEKPVSAKMIGKVQHRLAPMAAITEPAIINEWLIELGARRRLRGSGSQPAKLVEEGADTRSTKGLDAFRA